LLDMKEFFNEDYLKLILKLQQSDGCFGLVI
jgi:hypothetical protein